MNNILLFLVFISSLFLIFFFFLNWWKTKNIKKNEKPTASLEDLEKHNKLLSESLEKINEKVIVSSNTLINSIQKLPTVDKFDYLSKNFEKINEIFLKNKIKGIFGEFQLEEILKNYFGENEDISFWKTQYTLNSKENSKIIADAVIFLDDKNIIVIDSKLPTENLSENFYYQENLDDDPEFNKKYLNNIIKTIDNISATYKKVDNFKVKYVLMFVPSDSIYSILSNSKTILKRGFQKNVVIVSPSLLFITLIYVKEYTKDILLKKNAKEIINSLKNLEKIFLSYKDSQKKCLDMFQKSLTNLEKSNKDLEKISQNFEKAFALSFKLEEKASKEATKK
ncbi:DNA recombination protein RmuC [symbiont of Argiope bruennichi]|uniref:DNA recombination protein RmuC n=1 Tax=symbiont of Argiope bruennichi TaxID=2810479 RepID=UPI003DA2C304